MTPTAAMIEAAKKAIFEELEDRHDITHKSDDEIILHAGCTPQTAHITINVLDLVTTALAAAYGEMTKQQG